MFSQQAIMSTLEGLSRRLNFEDNQMAMVAILATTVSANRVCSALRTPGAETLQIPITFSVTVVGARYLYIYRGSIKAWIIRWWAAWTLSWLRMIAGVNWWAARTFSWHRIRTQVRGWWVVRKLSPQSQDRDDVEQDQTPTPDGLSELAEDYNAREMRERDMARQQERQQAERGRLDKKRAFVSERPVLRRASLSW